MGRVFYVGVKKKNRKGEPIYVLRFSQNGKLKETYLGKSIPGEVAIKLKRRKWLKELKRKLTANVSEYTLYLIGYEGVKAEEFIKLLKGSGVDLLIDVRENPWSRRPEFRGPHLGRMLKKHGIIYTHMPALGNPGDIRASYKQDKDTFNMLLSYSRYIKDEGAALETIKNLLRRKRIALMCYEKDPFTCHRIVIAQELLLRGIINDFKDLRSRVDTDKVFLLCKNLS